MTSVIYLLLTFFVLEDGMRSYGGTVVQDIKNVDPSSGKN